TMRGWHFGILRCGNIKFDSVQHFIHSLALNIMNEADTCRRYVVPLLQAAGWENAPFSIAEQRYFTNPKGPIRVVGGKIIRGKPRRSDYLLRYRPDFPIAVIEAK